MMTTFALNATIKALPNQISIIEEFQERMALSEREVTDIEADILGFASRFEQAEMDPIANLALLRQIDDELQKLPDAEKSAYVEATEKSPLLVGDKQKSAFLWREDYDAKRAAHRLARYWAYRKELFGEEKCYLPLTLNGALKDDIGAFLQGTVHAIPQKDLSGRPIMFFDMSKDDPTKCTRESLLRVYWYMLEVMCEDEDARRRGIVICHNNKNVVFDKFDLSIHKSFIELEINYLPVKIRVIHSCHPPQFFHLTTPLLKAVIGKRHRMRYIVHYGSGEHVLQELSTYGIPPDRVPSGMCGEVVLNLSQWFCNEQQREEEKLHDPSRDGSITQIPSLFSISRNTSTSTDGYSRFSSSTINPIFDGLSYEAENLFVGVLKPQPSEVESERFFKRAKDRVRRRDELVNDDSKVRKTDPTKCGRKGDPRMDRALEEKLNDPDMTLLEALEKGGFVFDHQFDKPGMNDTKTLDEDNITLRQRKNQLNRRLRKASQK